MFNENEIMTMSAEEVAEVMRNSGEWIPECNERLCDLAGLHDEYAAADGEHFEAVVEKAAEILGVEVY